MLDMGFREELEAILDATPPGRRTGLFSATLPKPIVELFKLTFDARTGDIVAEAAGNPAKKARNRARAGGGAAGD